MQKAPLGHNLVCRDVQSYHPAPEMRVAGLESCLDIKRGDTEASPDFLWEGNPQYTPSLN